MIATRTVSNPRIGIEHPRLRNNVSLPSQAFLRVDVDWIKAGLVASCAMTEEELYRLAENALQIAGILRRGRA